MAATFHNDEGKGPGGELPDPGVTDTPPARRKLVRAAKWAGLALASTLLVGAIAVLVIIEHYSRKLPSVTELKAGYEPPQLTRIFAKDGTLLAHVFTERRTVVEFEQVPSHTKLAFLAAEDASFYEHEGLDYLGMLRALVVNVRAGKTLQGGSTITQQVVKNVLLHSGRTYERKIRETILARRLEQHLSKDEILELYLNHIYLGHGRYGVEEAARYYYGKKARGLSLGDSALLAGLVAAPERYSPRRDPDKAASRRRFVLDQMLAKGFITAELRQAAMDEPIALAPAVEAESELCPEAVSHSKKMLGAIVGDRAKSGGYQVTTTIVPRLQAAARRAVRDNLDEYAKRHGLEAPFVEAERKLWGKAFRGHPKVHKVYVGNVVETNDELGTVDVAVGDVVGRVFLTQETRYNPHGVRPSRFTTKGAALRVRFAEKPGKDRKAPLRLELGPQSALVAIDVRTRHVVAQVGSYEALAGGLDRATQARRQPGSAFKPFLYSYALHSRRFSPASILRLPNVRRTEGGSTEREVSVRTAVAKSDNAAAVRVFREAGPANVVRWAQAAGIESRLEPDASLALGAYEVTPLELANAYATFASGGTYATPKLLAKVVGPGGSEVALPPDPPPRRVMEPDEAYLTTSLLKSVIDHGTAERARVLGRPFAGKTGTTNDAKDAWFVGYSPEIVAAVWVGYDDAIPLGPAESGARTALPAWIDFMKAAHDGRPVTEFARPNSIVVARIDPATGLLARPDQQSAIAEEFLEGTAPEELSPRDAGVDEPEPGLPDEPDEETTEEDFVEPPPF